MHDKTIVILTGAGISAESGLATFRDNNGLWCNHRIEDVATPEAFERNPKLVHEFYNLRRRQLKEAKPNAAHHALAELAEKWQGRCFLVTQNVDDLHDRAEQGKAIKDGYKLLHMHGELKKARCSASEKVFDWHDDMTTETPCPCCQKAGRLRPHIVWFGEMPLHMDLIQHMLQTCDLFISIGTSGQVYPAAGFVQQVRMRGKGHTAELNLEPSGGHSLFHEKVYGPASQVVPHYVEAILAGKII
jgi:NAD-dependent deacetylase